MLNEKIIVYLNEIVRLKKEHKPDCIKHQAADVLIERLKQKIWKGENEAQDS